MDKEKNINTGEKKTKLYDILALILIAILAVVLMVVVRVKFFSVPDENVNEGNNPIDNVQNGLLPDDENQELESEDEEIETERNYEFLESGEKKNNSDLIKDAVFDLEVIKLYEFEIVEQTDKLCVVSGYVENTTDNVLEETVLVVRFYDSQDNYLTEFSTLVSDIEPHVRTPLRIETFIKCVNAAKIDIEILPASN